MADKKVEKKGETTTPEEETLEEEVEEVEEEEEESEEDDSEKDENPNSNLDTTDWKQVAQKEQELRKKAEDALAGRRYKTKHKKKDNDEGDEDEGKDQPLNHAELRQILADERESTRKEVLSEQTKRYARDLADSDEEAQAIVEIFNNRTFPSGMSHEDQVREAYFIAHGPRLLGKLYESKRALRSKETKSKSGAENTHRDAKKLGEPKLSPQDEAEFKRLGFTWDGKNYIKKLPNGKSLVKDWKTKKTFVR